MTASTRSRLAVPVTADGRFVERRTRPLIAYDEGLPPPPRPAAGPAAGLVSAHVDDVVDVVSAHCRVLMGLAVGNRTIRWTRQLLGWLEQFPGDDWEARWLASGADAAPRTWADAPVAAGVGTRRDHVTPAIAALLMARVLRPSYSWLPNSHLTTLFQRFPVANDHDGFARLRALPAYQAAAARHQADAESAIVRVMIRTGKPFLDLAGEDLLSPAPVRPACRRPPRGALPPLRPHRPQRHRQSRCPHRQRRARPLHPA